jgi:hypothetical protein
LGKNVEAEPVLPSPLVEERGADEAHAG